MFPISDSIKSKTFPYLTLLLIAANVYMFWKEITAPDVEAFIMQYALIPNLVDISNPISLVNFVTSMFLHAPGGILFLSLHLISNMWFLWIFGDDVEDHIGRFNFLFLYFISGIAGNALQFFMNPTSPIPMIGASGAVSGVLGSYYTLFPDSKIKSIIPIFFFLTILNVPAAIYLLYWFIIQLFSGIGSVSAEGGIAFFAHIGGFITGIFITRLQKGKSQPTGRQGYIEGEIVG